MGEPNAQDAGAAAAAYAKKCARLRAENERLRELLRDADRLITWLMAYGRWTPDDIKRHDRIRAALPAPPVGGARP